jgi:hypothetical protein
MRRLFFSSNRPRHRYKTEKFFTDFLRLRNQSWFGYGGKQESFYKKILIVRKFFMWYFQLTTPRLCAKLLQKAFLRKRLTFRSLTTFLNLLERQLAVHLVRARLTKTLPFGQVLANAGCVYVNGSVVKTFPYFLQIGDVVEVFAQKYGVSFWQKGLLFESPVFSLLRLRYFQVTQIFTQFGFSLWAGKDSKGLLPYFNSGQQRRMRSRVLSPFQIVLGQLKQLLQRRSGKRVFSRSRSTMGKQKGFVARKR